MFLLNLALCTPSVVNAAFSHEQMMHYKQLVSEECQILHKCPETAAATTAQQPCINGLSGGEYPCENVDLLSYVPLTSLGSRGDGNDIWGWTDGTTGREYAIVCTEDGTSFVDITDAEPRVLGFLPTATVASIWRDAKVIGNYALIVSEAKDHGMQVFDLTRLRNLQGTLRNNSDAAAVAQLKADAHYKDIGSSHNIFVNEETGYAYIVGAKGKRACNSVIHMVDVRSPLKPVFAGCAGDVDFSYCHDVQCVIYAGPDARFTGHEICFGSMGDSVGVLDVSDKSAVKTLNKQKYVDLEFCHQGWLFAGQSRFAMNDEVDEMTSTKTTRTRTLLYDVSDLTKPSLVNIFLSSVEASDHNNYVIEANGVEYIVQANYNAGLRLLRVDDARTASLSEVGNFDVAPLHSGAGFHGSWSVFPYYKSGKLVVNSIERGLFVLRPHWK